MNALKSEIEKQFYPVHTAWNETDKVYAMQLGKPSKAMANWITVIDDPSDPEFPSLDPKDVDFPVRVEHSDIDLCAELFLGCWYLLYKQAESKNCQTEMIFQNPKLCVKP